MSKPCIDVAYYWTPAEAAAVLEYLDRLRDCVWEMYHQDIIELRKVEGAEPCTNDDQRGLDPDIPF